MNELPNSLGFSKKPSETRVVVAMSGGVDSSVTAALLAEQGYDVVGITLQLYDHGEETKRKGACCAGQDIHDAGRVAKKIGIPHYVLNYERKFREEVIDVFADAYIRGETPIPCVLCNQTVKFRDLLATAQDLNADTLATGHYIRRVEGTSGPELHRSVDNGKDQSYFLFATTKEQLEYLRFPLGDLTKDKTRALAKRFDLPVAAKPDSQDICFVPDGRYADVVLKLRPEANEPGNIVDLKGQVIGHHNGIIHYTVGQRRGIDIGGLSEPFYVIQLNPMSHEVIVGPREALETRNIVVTGVNWLGHDEAGPIECDVKVRSTQVPTAASIIRDQEGSAQVSLAQAVTGVALGQACVFYDGDRVLGGGWICRETEAVPTVAA